MKKIVYIKTPRGKLKWPVRQTGDGLLQFGCCLPKHDDMYTPDHELATTLERAIEHAQQRGMIVVVEQG